MEYYIDVTPINHYFREIYDQQKCNYVEPRGPLMGRKCEKSAIHYFCEQHKKEVDDRRAINFIYHLVNNPEQLHKLMQSVNFYTAKHHEDECGDCDDCYSYDTEDDNRNRVTQVLKEIGEEMKEIDYSESEESEEGEEDAEEDWGDLEDDIDLNVFKEMGLEIL